MRYRCPALVLGLLGTAFALSGCFYYEGPLPQGYDPAADVSVAEDEPAHRLMVRMVVETGDGAPAGDVDVMAFAPGGRPVVVRTGPDGIATFRLKPDVTITIETLGLPDYTNERIDAITTGAVNTTSERLIIVYKGELLRSWSVAFDGPLHPVTSAYTGQQAYWLPAGPTFSEDPALEQAYLERITGLYVRITWSNSALGHGDLGIAIGPSESEMGYLWDRHDQGPADGTVEENLRVPTERIQDSELPDVRALYIGPATQEPIIAPLGLEVDVEVHAWFGEIIEEAPGPSIPVVAVVLMLLIAFVARRRPQ
ncbi:MAG: hypothetical protein KY455_11610 [Euryarchaeota archaeon]|nr:hypothetical protein [Euryarchaeota archaeon]